ncbi:hypothetical protein AB0K00_52170 [Dactylosporangium sp. NPDC049525]|uniref:hypothetical protein n=1 Tax=Dactylosporangium sp. NPDC049525 TaxID=3154730 RepID=UPI0034282969
MGMTYETILVAASLDTVEAAIRATGRDATGLDQFTHLAPLFVKRRGWIVAYGGCRRVRAVTVPKC